MSVRCCRKVSTMLDTICTIYRYICIHCIYSDRYIGMAINSYLVGVGDDERALLREGVDNVEHHFDHIKIDINSIYSDRYIGMAINSYLVGVGDDERALLRESVDNVVHHFDHIKIDINSIYSDRYIGMAIHSYLVGVGDNERALLRERVDDVRHHLHGRVGLSGAGRADHQGQPRVHRGAQCLHLHSSKAHGVHARSVLRNTGGETMHIYIYIYIYMAYGIV